MPTQLIGFGGGCHWCTEAVFQSLVGVERVDQGWMRSVPPDDRWSEAVRVHFDAARIDLKLLIEVHLLTHASTSAHSFRQKYRSAIYVFDATQRAASEKILENLRVENQAPYITQVLPFAEFRRNEEKFLNYYQTRPEAPFCQTYIHPKLEKLRTHCPEFFKTVR